MIFTVNDYYMGRDQTYHHQLTSALRMNAAITVQRVNELLRMAKEAGVQMEGRYLTSGWRPGAVNATTPGAAMHSKHITCQAADIADPDGDLDEFLLDNPRVLEDAMCWMEHPSATKGWSHVQTVPPRSGKRAFYP